jgi:hypothetical protein
VDDRSRRRVPLHGKEVVRIDRNVHAIATGKYWTVDYQLREKAREILKNSNERSTK